MKTARVVFTILVVALGVLVYILFANTDSDYSPGASSGSSENSLYNNLK